MLDPTYPAFPIFAFISFVVVLIPLPWHLQAWNVGTVSYMVWTALAALNKFINTVVWRNDAINYAPVWCDISTRIIVATNVAIPCASLTITRRLYKITSVRTVTADPKEKRREMIIDLLVCVGFPLFQLVLYWFIQGHRFNILEQIGCFPVAVNTPPAYPLIFMWPVLLGVISTIYCGFTLYAFLQRRKEMGMFLNTNSFITYSRYFRLMALSMMDTFVTIPLGSFVIWINAAQSPISPWRGLADVHIGFERVEQIPAVVWRMNRLFTISVIFSHWAIVFTAFLFVAFFGFAEENRKNYEKLYWRFAKRFGHYPKPTGTGYSGSSFVRTPNLANISATSASNNNGGLKVFTRIEKPKRDSLLSSIADLDSSITVDTTFEERKEDKAHDGSSDSLPASPDDIELAGLPTLQSRPNAPHPSEALTLNFPVSPKPAHRISLSHNAV